MLHKNSSSSEKPENQQIDSTDASEYTSSLDQSEYVDKKDDELMPALEMDDDPFDGYQEELKCYDELRNCSDALTFLRLKKGASIQDALTQYLRWINI